ncbi:MAG: saccharopine dehydrogenase family protein [Myxococcaceae bacterium]
MDSRRFDVLLYGAGGFTGRQTVAYFASHAPVGLRWAVAGRTLANVEAALGAALGPSRPVEVLQADSRDQASVDAAVSAARVVLSTAGPFALYGSSVVEACVRFRTHYVDITGETPWVADLIARHHARAAADGVRLIPCCGFDSVPSDLGALVLAQFLRAQGTRCGPVKAAFRFRGGLNGGTVASMAQLFRSGQMRRVQEPFLLDATQTHTVGEEKANRDPTRARWDTDFGRWLAPYLMAPINTRVVRRSASLLAETASAYGPHFAYQEMLAVRGGLQASALAAGMSLFQTALGTPARALLQRLLPSPGTGPSAQAITSGWFRCDLVASGEDGRKAYGLVQDVGDPGNAVTVKCLCESALALAVDTSRLPGGVGRGGVLTPATGLGDVLVERLRAQGMVLAAASSPPGG